MQQELLTTTLACDAGEGDAELCQTAGAMNAAMFEQWRRAASIYADLAGEAGAVPAPEMGADAALRGGN